LEVFYHINPPKRGGKRYQVAAKVELYLYSDTARNKTLRGESGTISVVENDPKLVCDLVEVAVNLNTS
jgi:hypothetical protein